MRPGARIVPWLVVLCAAALGVPLAPVLAWGLAAALAVLVVAALAEGILLGRITVASERSGGIVLALDEEDVVPLGLRTDATHALALVVRQNWPRLLAARSTRRAGICAPGEVLRLAFPVRGVARGSAPLAPPTVAFTRWGLAERIVPAGETAEISVLPNLKAVQRLHGQLNQYALRGLGARAAPHLGKGREFDRLRDYVTGDDFRDIAWKASARHNRFIVREFRLDRAQDILLCLDRGHRMAARVTRITRMDHAVNAAVLLAYLCNRMDDRAGMLSFADAVEGGVAPGRGGAHLRQLTAFATGVEPEYRHTDYLALAVDLRRRLRHRTLILLLTVLPEPESQHALVRAVELLAPQHLPLVVVLSDPDLEAAARFLPASKEELCRTLVARDIRQTKAGLLKELRRRGALVVETAPGDAGIASVNAYIDVKRRQLL